MPPTSDSTAMILKVRTGLSPSAAPGTRSRSSGVSVRVTARATNKRT